MGAFSTVMEEKPPLSSWQIVDDIVATYKIGRQHRALDKIAQALENPGSLTKEHRSLLRRVRKKLYKRLVKDEVRPVQSQQEPVWKPPEPVDPLLAELREAEQSGNQQAILSKLDQMLQQSETLAEAERRFLQIRRVRLVKVLNPDWQLPIYPSFEDFAPLHDRSQMYHGQGNHASGLSHAWAFAQYCAMGTVAFHLADSVAIWGYGNGPSSHRDVPEPL